MCSQTDDRCNCTTWDEWLDRVNNPSPDDSSCQYPQVRTYVYAYLVLYMGSTEQQYMGSTEQQYMVSTEQLYMGSTEQLYM